MMAGSADLVLLYGLRVLGRHGVTDFERQAPQPFEVDVAVEADEAGASTSDDLAGTVDYAMVADTVARVVSSRSYRLLEALAEAIASAVLELPLARAVTVEVRKLRPPLPFDVQAAGARIRREAGSPRSSERGR
jgi:dihydroneopterin aldolase